MSKTIWSDAEKQFVRENASRMKDADMAATLSRITGRTISLWSLRHVRQELGIVKRQGRGLCEVVARHKGPGTSLGLSVKS